MKQFLYLDTDLVNSIIAQHGKGLIDAVTTEKENITDNEGKKSVSAKTLGEAGAKIWKLTNAEVKLSLKGSLEGTKSEHDTTKEIIAKTLHDAAFDMAYDAINPIVIDSEKNDVDPGSYIEMKRVFDFVDFQYLENLFSKDGIVELLKKYEKEKILKSAENYKENSLNRCNRRNSSGKAVDKNALEIINHSNKQYDEIHEIIKAIGNIIPFERMLVSYDGYLIPTEDKYFRINPSALGFMYGGEIKCVGMITNIIGKDTNPNDEANVFATLQYSMNEVLRQILPTKEENMYVVSPIAIYYEN